jgi:hypothetical protein
MSLMEGGEKGLAANAFSDLDPLHKLYGSQLGTYLVVALFGRFSGR